MDLPGTGSKVCQPAPRRATVLPRVCKKAGGAALPLEQHVRRLLDQGVRGVIGLCGPPGSGKSTALAHVAAVLPSAAPISFIDGLGACGACAGSIGAAGKLRCAGFARSVRAVRYGTLD